MNVALFACLRRLLGRDPPPAAAASDPAQASPRAGSRSPASAAHPAPVESEIESSSGQPAGAVASGFDQPVDRRFTAALLGVGELRRDALEPFERRAIELIQHAATSGQDSSLVPRLPVVLPRLISLVRRDEVPAQKIVELLARDPTLVGEVVRMANSPRYRTRREITDLQEAMIILGQRGLIELVTGAAMRPIFSPRQGRFSRIAGTRLWDLAERCSHACVEICGDRADRFHAYLAGLVANVGLIPALRLLDNDYQEARPPDTEAFHDALRDAAAGLTGRIARQWDFPAQVRRAVELHSGPQTGELEDSLAAALRVADRVSKWHVLMPGLAGPALAGLTDAERRCYAALERAFGR
jgi:HD-like signal output (HDOD) protein